MKEIDIHRGNPSVDEAIDLLYDFLQESYRNKEKIVKIIVGYGSTSGISKIRDEAIIELESLKRRSQIIDFIFGNELDITSVKYHNFKGKDLIPSIEKTIRNKGCVFIII